MISGNNGQVTPRSTAQFGMAPGMSGGVPWHPPGLPPNKFKFPPMMGPFQGPHKTSNAGGGIGTDQVSLSPQALSGQTSQEECFFDKLKRLKQQGGTIGGLGGGK
jgi:hypothetical protein